MGRTQSHIAFCSFGDLFRSSSLDGLVLRGAITYKGQMVAERRDCVKLRKLPLHDLSQLPIPQSCEHNARGQKIYRYRREAYFYLPFDIVMPWDGIKHISS
jgi:hypothetical protein